MENQAESQIRKRSRMSWRNLDCVRTFLEACIKEVTENGREGASLKANSWKKVAEVLHRIHNVDVDQKQMKNHYDYMKAKYGAWCRLKNKTGNVYDPSTNTFHLTEEEWKLEIQANPKAESLKSSPLLFPDLCIALFDGTTATGVDSWGPSSRTPRTTPNLEADIQPNEVIHTNTEDQEVTNPSPNPHPSASQSQNVSTNIEGPRTKKNSRRPSNLRNMQFEDKLDNALQLIIEKNNGPSIKECKEKLESFNLSPEIRRCAIGIFCENASYREAFMLLDEEDVEPWIVMIAQKLGLRN